MPNTSVGGFSASEREQWWYVFNVYHFESFDLGQIDRNGSDSYQKWSPVTTPTYTGPLLNEQHAARCLYKYVF